ncbi:MAG: hypothetical protein ACRDGW_11585 [Actinomycetota bacterium]
MTSVFLIVLVGCATSPSGSAQHLVDSRMSSGVDMVEEVAAADAAHIVCERDAVRVETPVVRAHEEGVDVVFENPGGAWGFEFHPHSYDYYQGMGAKLGEGVSESTWTIPPGELTVACVPTARSRYYEPEAKTAIVTVVDPDGLFVPWDLICGFGEQFPFRIESSGNEDPAEVFRRVPGVRESDELSKPGYPRSPLHWPTFIVFRGGEAVARIGGPWIDGEWKLLVNACPGSGIEKH